MSVTDAARKACEALELKDGEPLESFAKRLYDKQQEVYDSHGFAMVPGGLPFGMLHSGVKQTWLNLAKTLAEQQQKEEQGNDTLDDEHLLWLVNEQIKGLLEGEGATEDHENVLQFLRSTGLPNGTVTRMHRALVHGASKVLP